MRSTQVLLEWLGTSFWDLIYRKVIYQKGILFYLQGIPGWDWVRGNFNKIPLHNSIELWFLSLLISQWPLATFYPKKGYLQLMIYITKALRCLSPVIPLLKCLLSLLIIKMTSQMHISISNKFHLLTNSAYIILKLVLLVIQSRVQVFHLQ